jgi:TetR/AcrR family transcriptional regulator
MANSLTQPTGCFVANNTRDKQKHQTQQRILSAAIEGFSEYGFDGCSLAEVAKRSNSKKALIQYHFGTKEELWKQAIGQLWREMRSILPHYLSQTPSDVGATQLRFVFRQIIRFARDNPGWLGIMFREAATPGPRLDWFINTYLEQDFREGTEFIQHAQQAGLLPPGSALHLLHIISGALTYVLVVAPLTERATGINISSDESLDTLVDLLSQLLMNPQH